jgi:hypothetical protein
MHRNKNDSRTAANGRAKSDLTCFFQTDATQNLRSTLVQPTVQQVRLFSIPKYLKFFKYYKSDTILHCKLYNSI